jgi:sugar lactone lactonase YvrE
MQLRAVAPLAEAGDGRGEVIEPAGLTVDAFGRIYVTDAALHRLQRLEADGRWIGEAGVLGSDPGQLRRPGDIGLMGALGVAILDRENRRVVSYDLFGRFIGVLVDLEASRLSDQIGRVDPVAMAIDRGGAVYIADADRDRILAFDFAGQYLRSLGGFGIRAGSLQGISGLAVSPKGELVTAERGARRVQRLDAGGRPIDAWPIDIASEPGMLPVAVDDSLRVAVADERTGVLRVYKGPGALLAQLEGLVEPRALVFASDGTLLVAEAGRVSRWILESRRAMPPAVKE